MFSYKVKPGIARVRNIKNIIAVTAGKGGVGKSTIAFNMALALRDMNYSVGILDADIYGPSLSLMVGEDYKAEVEDAHFLPLEKFGIQIMSFGFLVSSDTPAIWRGAIVNKAIQQLLFDTKWCELDVLILDTPPGTGDIHLTMCQKMPITGVVTVTIPNILSELDVTKAIAMYKKMSIINFGLISNFAYYECSNCHHKEDFYNSHNVVNHLAEKHQLDVLGELPFINTMLYNSQFIITQDSQYYDKIFSITEKMLSKLKMLPKALKDLAESTIKPI